MFTNRRTSVVENQCYLIFNTFQLFSLISKKENNFYKNIVWTTNSTSTLYIYMLSCCYPIIFEKKFKTSKFVSSLFILSSSVNAVSFIYTQVHVNIFIFRLNFLTQPILWLQFKSEASWKKESKFFVCCSFSCFVKVFYYFPPGENITT